MPGSSAIFRPFAYLMGMKQLYIIGGPNGAGKTTASFTILPEMLNCREFVNADEMAKGISPLNLAEIWTLKSN